MSGFYRNLLTHNVAMGAAERSVGVSGKVQQELQGADAAKIKEEEERQRKDAIQRKKERAKRNADLSRRLAEQVEYREVPGKKPELSEEEVRVRVN